jgi:hypothetical protein
MEWTNTEYGFSGFNDRAHASCNIEQNRIIVYPDTPVDVLYNGNKLEKIEITLESIIQRSAIIGHPRRFCSFYN